MASTKTPEKAKAPAKKTTKSPAKKAPSKKPKDMTKVKVTISDKATADLSEKLDKVPRTKADKQIRSGKKSAAARAVSRKLDGPFPMARWLVLIPLGMLAFFLKFCMEGYSFSALVCLCLMGVILFYNLTHLLGKVCPKFTKAVRTVFTIALCIGLLIVGTTEFLVIKTSLGSRDKDFQYLVVLGAKVRPDGPSLSLQNRIDAAYDYLTANPDCIAIVTGGKGTDEPITEARCMAEHLTAMGIDPSRIWLEDKATSTWENLQFTLNLIEEKTGTRPEKLGILSSEYHLFRASLFARDCGVEFAGIPAKTTKLSLKINGFMREVAGVWHYILLGGQYHD